jgi:serine/threonine protein kinase
MDSEVFITSTDKLDSGGFGIVYSAHSTHGWTGVAKRVASDKAYFAELSILRQLPLCANLSNVIHANDVERTLFFDHAGVNFFDIVERGYHLPTEAWVQLFSAVALLHNNDIAHRDLKLENLMWNGWIAKIIDFGLAKVGDSRRCHSKYGTRSYCAPEVLTKKPHDGAKADLWSLGVCLFAYCCGFFPFTEASDVDWRWQRLKLVDISTKAVLDLYQAPIVRLPHELSCWGIAIDRMLTVDASRRELPS